MTKAQLKLALAASEAEREEAERRAAYLGGQVTEMRSRLLQLTKDYQALLEKIEACSPVSRNSEPVQSLQA